MLLDIVVIVLRETLEASILIGVLLSIGRQEHIEIYWVFVALIVGGISAIVYALNLGVISELFDYFGQEIINALMQYLIYCVLVMIIAAQYMDAKFSNNLKGLMVVAVSLALTREGGELFVFFSGFFQSDESILSVMTGGFIGLAVGLSAGAIAYYSLAIYAGNRARTVHTVVLVFVAAGMVNQATQLLIQADWVTAGQPLWDSNRILPESSVFGQLVYAVFGYEATPSKVEFVTYICSFMLSVGVVLICRSRFDNNLSVSKS